ncbi:MAG: aminotransferase class V-fold PLP-dependent enzyme, partial [Deltaproteobacteria bacterium]|nr:aminotransferase class V-fold PLP-dependent enzyme [Nannocystaceae bacterium]
MSEPGCGDPWMALRASFPIFEQRVYLASQCLGPWPRQAHRDLEQYRSSRQLHNRALDAWFERIDLTTKQIEHLIAAPRGSVALRESATGAHAALLAAIEPSSARNRLVVTELDFHSTLHLCSAQTRRGFELVVVPSRDHSRIVAEDVLAQIDERTAVVSVAMVSRYSALLDVSALVARAHEVGALVIVDAYQAAGIVPLDVVELGVDALVAGNHKWLSGDTGLAFLYVEPALVERLQPMYPGWFGHQDIDGFVHAHTFVDAYRPVTGARRFQQGTPPMQPIYGARAGLELVLEVGVARLRARNLELTAQLWQGASELGLRC